MTWHNGRRPTLWAVLPVHLILGGPYTMYFAVSTENQVEPLVDRSDSVVPEADPRNPLAIWANRRDDLTRS